jgi:hypothetical protein
MVRSVPCLKHIAIKSRMNIAILIMSNRKLVHQLTIYSYIRKYTKRKQSSFIDSLLVKALIRK